MKMAFVIGSLTGGGAERVAMNLVSHINSAFADSVQCDLIVLNKTGDYQYEGPVIFINEAYDQNNILRKAIYHYYLYVKKLKDLKEKKVYDMVISFTTLPNIVNIRSKGKEKCVISIRNYTSLNLSVRQQNRIRHYYHMADRVVAVSEVCREDMIENFGINANKISVIYNPYDLETIQSRMLMSLPESDTHLFDNTKTIVAVGRISKQKAFWRLIKAVALLKGSVDNIQLVILGKELHGKEQTELLRALIDKYELDEQVHLLGFKHNPYQYMYNGDVYALSSRFEGFPNGMAEAMACGLPIVSVNCLTGPLEILAPKWYGINDVDQVDNAEYGILVQRYEPDESLTEINEGDRRLAKAIEAVLTDVKMAQQYRTKAKERIDTFHVRHIIGQWLRLE